ncbi:unnamed protein product, partial [marine sediment metagenome]
LEMLRIGGTLAEAFAVAVAKVDYTAGMKSTSCSVSVVPDRSLSCESVG